MRHAGRSRETGLRWAAAALALSSCVLVVPPPSHLTGVPATVARDGVSADAAAAIGPEPAGALAASFGAGRYLALDLLGQASDSHASLTPGVWWRAPFGPEHRHRLGLRTGVVGGSGALGEAFAFENPYVGPALHAQYGWRFGPESDNPGILAVTLGGEYTLPVGGELYQSTLSSTGTTARASVGTPEATANGPTPHPEPTRYLRVPGAWVTAGIRLELPVGEQLGFTVDLGTDSLWSMGLVPHAAAGLRLVPRGKTGP